MHIDIYFYILFFVLCTLFYYILLAQSTGASTQDKTELAIA
jgi:hypothetical protein